MARITGTAQPVLQLFAQVSILTQQQPCDFHLSYNIDLIFLRNTKDQVNCGVLETKGFKTKGEKEEGEFSRLDGCSRQKAALSVFSKEKLNQIRWLDQMK